MASAPEPVKFDIHVTVTGSCKPVDCLQSQCALSKQQLKQAMQKGAVWLTRKKHTQRLRRVTRELQAGDELHLYYDETVLAQTSVPAQLIAEEVEYSVWFKPSMMLSQGSKYGDHCAIARYVEVETDKPTFIVHRLDRAACGLMLLAHSKKAAVALSELFQQRKIEKHYRVYVKGEFQSVSMDIESPIDDKSALSKVERLSYDKQRKCSLLDVMIPTGRKHQIRKHLAEVGFPVIGDRLYGAGTDDENLQLMAFSLQFQCPFSNTAKSFSVPDHLRIDV